MTSVQTRGKTTAASNAGSFAPDQAPEAGLEALGQRASRDWGQVSVREGARTPWGAADSVSYPADGIAVVGTPSHGGVKLSAERNAEIPSQLRRSSGWYEEDCEAAIVGMYHPDAFRGDQAGYEKTVKDWFPDQYEAATGTTLTGQDSYMRREQEKRQSIENFRAEHADEFVTLGNGWTPANHKWIPEGYVVADARMDEVGETRSFLMPDADAIHDHMWGKNVLIDPTRHLDVTGIADLAPGRPDPYSRPSFEPIHGDDLVIDYSGLSPAQSARARRELEKVWRFQGDDGEVIESLQSHLARLGVTGKRPISDGNGSLAYLVELPDSRVHHVSKAAYDAVSVPSTQTDLDRASIEHEKARARHERIKSKPDFDDLAGWRAKEAQALAEREAAGQRGKELQAQQDAVAAQWRAECDRLRSEALRARAADAGYAL
ncbi:MAG: DUF7007 domain-containing protein [Mycobacterium sp.]